jgi:hypothetical protein
MQYFVNQPWWVDLMVALLPFIALAVILHFVRGRNCRECGHKATVRHVRRHFCDRCFRKKFGESTVTYQRVIVETPPLAAASAALAAASGRVNVPAPTADTAPGRNGKTRSTEAKRRRRSGKKRAS